MKKYLIKKILVLVFISFIGLGASSVFAVETTTPVITPDTTPPVITLVGGDASIKVGDTYTDQGATATDNIDGDITKSIVVTNNVDTAKAGDYTVSYDVKDRAGNSAIEVIRKVTVSAPLSDPQHLSINISVDVPVKCDVKDIDGIVHNYIASSSNSYIAICALQVALDSGAVASTKLSNQYPSMGLFVTSFNNIEADPNSQYWALYQNDKLASLGISSLPISVGDTIVFKLQDFSGNNIGDSVTIKIKSLITPDTTPPVITLVGGDASIKVGDTYTDQGATATDNIDGDITKSIVVTNNVDTAKAGDYTVSYDVKDRAGNSAIEVIRKVTVSAPLSDPEKILIRNGDTVIYDGSVPLPASGTVSIADKNGVKHDVNADSLLATLYSLTQSSDNFQISDLEYYDSMKAFYLKCITPKGASELCDNWQYTIGNTYPSTGVDSTILSGGESIGLYFGTPHQLILDKNSITTGSSVTVTAQKYNYLDNTWSVLSGVSIDVTVPNNADPYNPTIVSETPVDIKGQAVITLSNVGTYTLGIKEDYSFPSYTVTVTTPPITSGGGGGGGAPVPQAPVTLSIPQAISFLSKNQKTDGSFGDMLYTDWAAIAISSAGTDGQDLKSKISDYLKNNPLTSSIVTDNERHAMALMSLDINPYSGTGINYIDKITSSFDGTQFGDGSLINDDIFAMIVLANAGYTSSDQIVSKDVGYILSQASSDGSWGGVDMTAAAIQALNKFIDLPNVTQAISKAKTYLINTQGSDGGFGNSSSTSWVLPVLALDPSLSVNTTNADKYLLSLQQSDGGVDPTTNPTDSRIWTTSYAIPGALHLLWSNILQTFPKPTVTISSGSGASQLIKNSGGGGPLISTINQTQTIQNTQSPSVSILKPVSVTIKPVSAVTLTPSQVQISEKLVAKILADLKNTETNKKIQNKPKIIESTIKPEINKPNNSLMASANISSSSQTLPISTIDRIISTIEFPFKWLWFKLGF